MRIYDFLEFYPNPYKPSIDTEIVELLRVGHDVTVLAEGAYLSTLHDAFVEHGLASRTRYYPATLRNLRAHGGRALKALLTRPASQLPRARTVLDGSLPAKANLLAVARTMLLPVDEPDLCYVHNIITASRLPFLRRLYPRARICMYFHGGEVAGYARTGGESEILRHVDAVVSNTRFSAAQFIARGCPPEKMAVIPVGFHMPDYQPTRPRRYRPAGPVRFVTIGRMSSEKGILDALQAIKALWDAGERSFTYRLIGTGRQLAELQAFVQANGLASVVTFAGEKKKRDVISELDQADALILPSLITDTWAETQAAVVQEALLMGCLTVTTLAGGVPESNAPEMRQFAMPPGDVPQLTDRLRAVLRLAPEEMAVLGQAGRGFAERYDIQPLMARIVAHAMGRLPADDPGWYVPRASA
jgi:colanic acid/amylovoran biosynthesis glycosyltransferase